MSAILDGITITVDFSESALSGFRALVENQDPQPLIDFFTDDLAKSVHFLEALATSPNSKDSGLAVQALQKQGLVWTLATQQGQGQRLKEIIGMMSQDNQDKILDYPSDYCILLGLNHQYDPLPKKPRPDWALPRQEKT